MSETIVLTSAGLKVPIVGDEIVKRLPKSPSETKLAHVITASNVADDTDYVDRDKKAMLNFGFDVVDVVLEGKDETELYELLKRFDVIYVQGGNGFYLLRHIRRSGFDNVVRKLLKKGVWYVGVSAGTYVCCPTIEMHNWKRVRENWYGLESLEAMNLVPFLVSVHYNREKYREELSKAIPSASCGVKVLTDEQALMVVDGKVELIGVEPEIKVSEIV